MSEGLISTAVTTALHEALRKAQADGELRLEVWPNLVFDIPKRAEWGDLSTTVAMGLAKGEKRPPREIADVIASHLQGETDLFDHVDVVPPGYINLTLKRDQWFRVLTEIERQGASYGRSTVRTGQKILIEFVSANPTGPLHVGHGRGAAVGDALAHLLTRTGADVSREYYVNDIGTQIETLGKSVLMRTQQQSSSVEDQDAPLPEGLYQGQYISEIAAAFTESQPSTTMNSGEADAVAAGRFAKDIILR